MWARSSWREAKDCAQVGHWPMTFLRLEEGGESGFGGVVCGCVVNCVSAIVDWLILGGVCMYCSSVVLML